MFREARTISLTVITAVFVLLLFVAHLTLYDRPIVRYCCTKKNSCIDLDEVTAREIDSNWPEDYRYSVIKERPCEAMHSENESFIIQEVTHDTLTFGDE